MEFVHDYTFDQWEALDPAAREGTIVAPLRSLAARLGSGHAAVRQFDRSSLWEQYYLLVIEGIVSGNPVSEAVLAGDPVFREGHEAQKVRVARRTALYGPDGPNRYTDLLGTHGIALRMADWSPVEPELREQARKAMDGVESALGPCADIWRTAGLTIIYGANAVSGKDPDALGALHPDLMTIALARRYRDSPFHMLPHELGHLLDLWRPHRPGFADYTIYRMESAVASSGGGGSGRDVVLYRRAVAAMRCGDCAGGCRTYPGGFACRTRPGDCKCLPSPRTSACAGLQAMQAYFRSPREVWARLVEQYVATRASAGSRAVLPGTCYQALPPYWSREAFAALEPLIGEAIDRRRAHWLARP